ncbi:ABC transporter substrate-binding protein [Amycolatopsis keratiniphila]|uniref:Putative glutamine transport system substrate-binding protein n=1 Tax=Amycolatopsis keratiniphila TaxID=129921 RepID=R4SWG4_9PSEU|nr:ABC transporter substrate-binding protein [Amycolatopsis keratiniphila]AGM04476.1 putative glutamine transport system substrate-binding protein [Amycolatopsis keratiniphila]
MRKPRVLLGLLLVLVLVSSSCAATDQRTSLQRIRDEKVLRVGIGASPPLTIRRGDGSYIGLDVDLIDQFARSLGVRVEYVGTSYATIIAGLQSGKYDMITSLQAREERRKAVDFADPLLSMGGAWLVAKTDARLTDLASLNDPSVTIACLAGGAQCLICRHIVPKAKLRELPSAGSGLPELISELGSGRANAVAAEALIMPAILAKYPQFRVIPESPEGVDPVPVGWSVPKGDHELLAELNRFVAEKKADRTIDEALKKWITPENSLGG